MSSHTHHPSVQAHGLADGCPRCEEHARDPFISLDYPLLRELATRVRDGLPARSDNEAMAMVAIQQSLRRANLLTEVTG